MSQLLLKSASYPSFLIRIISSILDLFLCVEKAAKKYIISCIRSDTHSTKTRRLKTFKDVLKLICGAEKKHGLQIFFLNHHCLLFISAFISTPS